MKQFIFILSTILVLVACNTEILDNQNEGTINASKVVFDFTVNYPNETRAVKTGWQKGDKVFVFFNDVTTAYVTIVYNGKKWSYELIGDATLPTSGKLTAVYLPFGSDLTASYASGWTFSTTQYSYYLAASDVDFTISSVDNVSTLSATIVMQNPGGFAHFYMADASASDGAYTLATDAVIPAGIASISSDGTISETEDKHAGEAMEGYKYGGGYSFSGKVDDSFSKAYGANYYFIKTKTADNSREDYFTSVSDTLKERTAVSLPANGDAKWIPVGIDKWVDMGKNDVLFATCNADCNAPEERGNKYNRSYALSHGVTNSGDMGWLNNENNCTWTWMKVNGCTGMVVKSKTRNEFIFLAAYSDVTDYWAIGPDNTKLLYHLQFRKTSHEVLSLLASEWEYLVRSVKKKE